MNFKALLKKITPGKKEESPEIPIGEDENEPIQHEISFERQDTSIEDLGIVGEIDLYINDEKINIFRLGPLTKIGRDPAQVDIVIPELIVSKFHCTIYSQDDRFFVKDNSSTNGVYINDQKITEQEIKHDDTILLGRKGTVKLVLLIRR